MSPIKPIRYIKPTCDHDHKDPVKSNPGEWKAFICRECGKRIVVSGPRSLDRSIFEKFMQEPDEGGGPEVM